MTSPTTRTFLAGSFALLVALGSGCGWIKRISYEGFGRDRWQKPDQVIAALDLAHGARVADLGAGGGYFTFRLADAVGGSGKVYAVDVDRGMIEYLEGRIAEESRANVATVMAEYGDAKLPEPVDLIFTSNTYHHLEERPTYFLGARRYLRPGGRVAIIDYKPQGLFQWIFPHSTEGAVILSEMESAGYRLEKDHGFLEKQSFLVFSLNER